MLPEIPGAGILLPALVALVHFITVGKVFLVQRQTGVGHKGVPTFLAGDTFRPYLVVFLDVFLHLTTGNSLATYRAKALLIWTSSLNLLRFKCF